ncbi:hypothetical protein HBH96_143580 [Parastagonospora nodorum]|nr:hypothetical protein HBH82_167460 [Parastagonospora nodorum]KAH4679603.1 hypothetical protein HBH78_137310 [Parastagonospora nodorum]KAH4696132.1 hypothetical protein HBH67_189840 [Parastagonospora nodorum]KAH4771543.1 hypothetical protein HBH63_148860 [Parastagonospora nodorum]KAH4776712.1 hypothetical protein HBH62_164230 [Parastagonospora nodorum]
MAKKAKGAKAAKVALPRPTASPYASPFVTLQLGPDRQKYYLPEVLLERLKNVPGRDPWTGVIRLVDVDASIGHVLIHFLHTGVYQTLNEEGSENVDNSVVRNEFQKAVLTLEAAKKYGVPGLQELAQCAIRETFVAGPPHEHAWLRDYVSKKFRCTFEQDLPAPSALDFFESIESPTLTKLLAQIIVGLYSEEVEKLRKEMTATRKISTPERDGTPGFCSPYLPNSPPKRIAVISNAWPVSVEKFGAFDDSSAAWDPHNLGQNQNSVSEASTVTASIPCNQEERKEEMLHTVEEHAEASAVPGTPEVEADPYAGLSKSQTKKLKAKLDKEAKLKKEENIKRQIEGEAVEILRQEEDAERIRLEAELKKIEDEEAAAVATKAEECKKEDDDIWGDRSGAVSTVTKKKKGKKAEHIRLEEEEAELILLEETQAECIRLEEEGHMRMEEEERRRMEEEERRRMEEEEAAATIAEAEEAELKKREEEEAASKPADWGASIWGEGKKKKKKETTKDRRLRERKEEEERLAAAAAEAEEAELKKVEEDEATAAATEAGVNAFDVTTEKGAISNDDDCELRLEHLSRDDGWKNCKPCELYMRDIAIKLHLVGLPNVNGFSTIN